MATDSNDRFDFDTWSELARSNPEAFDKQRLAATTRLIEQAPAEKQQRLRGLQWQVDMAVKRSKSPLEGCLQIHRLMMEKLCDREGLRAQLNSLANLLEGHAPVPEASASNDNPVINFNDYRQH